MNNTPNTAPKKGNNMVLAAMVAQVVCLIFTFLKTFTAEFMGFEQSASLFGMEDGLCTVLAVLALVAFIAAVGCTFLGMSGNKKMNFYALIASAAAVIVLIVAWIVVVAKGEGFVSMNVLGFVQLILAVVAAVFAYFNNKGKKLF